MESHKPPATLSPPMDDLVPLGTSPAPNSQDPREQNSPSRVSNTLEHQMQVNTDPRLPRGEPQLVGLTSLRYDPSKVSVEIQNTTVTQNYIIEGSKYFFPDKPSSKRVSQMKAHSKHLAQSESLVKVTINLPYQMLIEQVNLNLRDHTTKKQSDFSKNFALMTVITEDSDEMAMKSAYSECVTRTGKLEYNLVGVTSRLILVFAKDQQAQPISLDWIKIQQADLDLEDQILAGSKTHGIQATDDDDFRILDSLPTNHKKVPQEDQLLSKLIQSIEIIGFNMLQVPAITNLTYFMNQQLFLQSHNSQQQANQIEFMTGQLLVTTKRATQAIELYRKMQIRILTQSSQPSSINQQCQLVKCAVYELLIADSLSPNLQLNEKVQSIQRLSCFLRGEHPQDINHRFAQVVQVAKIDSFSSMLANLPDCLRFTIACLSHRQEIVKISALKMLKYILETLGCSLDYGMVLLLQAMLSCYPVEGYKQRGDFDFQRLIGVDITIEEYLFKEPGAGKQAEQDQASVIQHTEEPQSGSKRAMVNIYNHVLDTFISVLSSVSSHILHSIFYDVIEPTLLVDSGYPIEVRVFTCKIADKIFTICQGDLILTPRLLDTILTLTSQKASQLPDSIEQTANTQVKNLWQSIRQKVLPNYSTRGFQSLVKWLVIQLTDIKQNQDSAVVDDRVRQMAEVITIIAIGRQKNEEEANQLIKLPSFERYGGGPSSELYLVLAPLLFWLEYSVDREERFSLFMQIYQTIKDVLNGLPKGQSDLDITTVMFPSLQRASDFMAGNSPNLSMLKFLDMVLADMIRVYQKSAKSQVPIDIQHFFLDMLMNFVPYLSYSLYEEILFVFEKLIILSADIITEKVICAGIIGLIDKYTPKSKQLKTTVATFMKFLLNTQQREQKQKQQNSPTSHNGIEDMLSEDNNSQLQRSNYFEMMADFCFFSNLISGSQRQHKSQIIHKQLEFRSPQDLHELNVEKLQFFIECLSQMDENHITVFTNLITHPSFRHSLLTLVDNGESQIRLKAHEIIESLTQYFVQYCPSKTVYEFTNGTNQNEMMDAEFISHERLYISQIVIQVAKVSLEKQNDCYLQFNSLILLDFLFQNLLPVPTFQNELLKQKRNGQKQEGGDEDHDDMLDEVTMDVEILSISESTPELDVMDPAYLRMRMKLVFSLWPHIQAALNSPWSNIRSICYGLICSMLKIDVNDYPKEEPEKLLHQHLSYEESDNIQASQAGLTQFVLPMLYSLLGSKESESKAGGLNILGSFCGLSYDFTSVKIHKHLTFFQRNSKFVSNQIWKLVFSLQDDWDITIKEASVVLIQLCAPRNAILYFQNLKESKEKQKLEYMRKMAKASDVYARNAQFKDFTQVDSGEVRSEHARRAIQIFPTAGDCKQILDNATIDRTSDTATLQQFMLNKQTTFPTDTLNSSQIIEMSDVLTQLIFDFNPNYEDKRLTGKGAAPMSRRRQIEIELNLNGRGKEKEEVDPNFFVDTYSDDQIQEIISIFRNDFKPPKNLWIEKQPNQSMPQNYGHHGQPAASSSPDFFQDIYADAIEQFNQHQMMMQQRQQDELQQQVSSGHSMSQSSFATEESEKPCQDTRSQNSSTPSPPILNHLQEEATKKPYHLQSNQNTPVVGGQWPTSPVLVSNSDKSLKLQTFTQEEKKPQEQIEQIANQEQTNFYPSHPPDENQMTREVEENYGVKPDDYAQNNLFAKTQKFEGTDSAPDFNFVKNTSPKAQKRSSQLKESQDGSGSGANSGGDQRISRKNAQTYLSNLNQGYLQGIDHEKLLTTCFNQKNLIEKTEKNTQSNSLLNLNLNATNKNLNIKSQAELNATQVTSYGSTKSQRGKKNASNSPEVPRKSSKLGKKTITKDKHQTHSGHTTKQTNNLAELNFFIKTIEKDIVKNQSTSYPSTPSTIIKKVEDQMRALGVDPNKMFKQDSHREKPQMKLLALNQIVKHQDDSQTLLTNHRYKPHHSSPQHKPLQGHETEAEFCKTQRLLKKTNPLLQSTLNMVTAPLKTTRGDSESRERDLGDRQSTGRGAGSNKSAIGNSYSQQLLMNQPAVILTDRSSQNGHNSKSQLKQSQTTRFDSAQLFQFKKAGKSQSKVTSGYGALAGKPILSPTLKRDQQSGGLVLGKGNLTMNMIQTPKTTTNQNLKKGKVNFNSKNNILDGTSEISSKPASSSRYPQSTRNLEQGDKKQFSPDATGVGKPPLKTRKKSGHSGSNIPKPFLELQQPSYF